MEEAPAKQQDGQEENSLGHWLSPREGAKSLPVRRREPPPGRGSCRGHKAQSASRPAAPRTPRAPTPSQGSTHRKTRDSHPADDHVEAQTAPRPRPSPRGSPAPGPSASRSATEKRVLRPPRASRKWLGKAERRGPAEGGAGALPAAVAARSP
nr:PREDICTED: proline-rich receptor-like protein kinase PERK10 [Equus przewalskii]